MTSPPPDPQKAAELRLELLTKMKAGWASSVRTLLYQGADPNTKDDDGVPVLIRALSLDAELVDTLIAHGADETIPGPDGLDARAVAAKDPWPQDVLRRALGDRACDQLRAAMRNKNIDRVQEILESGVIGNLNEKRRNGWAPLRLALAEHCVEGLDLLLQAGANPNADPDLGDKSPLGEAMTTWEKKIQLVSKLLEYGADPNKADSDGRLPLLSAAKDGNETLTLLLLRYKADPNIADSRGNTALHEAAMAGQCEVIRLLAAGGAALYPANSSGYSPMETAILYRRRDAFEALVDAGCNPCYLGQEGTTLLMLAAWAGDAGLIGRLAAAGIPIDAQRETEGNTALMWAAQNGKAAATRKLLALGANCDLTNKEGQTALDMAREAGHAQVEQIITDYIADETRRGLRAPLPVKKAFKIVLGTKNAKP